MLSTIGRAAIRRIGGGPAPTNRAFQSLWALKRAESNPTPSQTNPRSYATAAATKTTAAKPKAKTTAAAKTGVKAKPKAKKTAVKKVVKKVVKKKAPTKKKTAVKKPVVKKKKKVELTDEQKKKAEIKLLKTKALLEEEPDLLPATAWAVMMKDELKNGTESASARMPAVAAMYKSLTPSEVEALNHTANQNKAANAITQKRWIESHTPDEINLANNARRLLRKRTNTKKFRLIIDERIPKRPATAMLFFVKERHSSGDLKGVGDFKTVTTLLMDEWKALSESEKKPYEEAAASDKARYVAEYKTVFKRDSKSKN